MRYLYCFFILFCFNSKSFAQKQNAVKSETKEIESGRITKQFTNGKLTSFTVDMAAVNYGNTLFFTKEDNIINIKDGQKPDALIRIYLKDKRYTTDLQYQNKELMYIESIDLDLNNLPPNSIISSQYKDGKPESFISRSQMEDIRDLDKVMKLFLRMDKKTSLTNIDTIFDTLADDFSQEDALLKIYFGRYAKKYEPLPTAYLNTDNTGKIKKGIMWTKTSDQNGKYNIYSNGKVIKSVNQNLTDFQKTIMDYMEKM
ncbi:hypothetical protein HZP44_02920 [Elizabethkingia anophelis]|nr:hypothetical protein [Elizabethkingia anophelis]MCT4207316.1 hypothetical protein [Elizabethkingia anophelis]